MWHFQTVPLIQSSIQEQYLVTSLDCKAHFKQTIAYLKKELIWLIDSDKCNIQIKTVSSSFFYCAFGDGFAAQQVETLLFSITTAKMLKEADSWTSLEARGWSLHRETVETMKWAEEGLVSMNDLGGKGRSEGRMLQQPHG